MSRAGRSTRRRGAARRGAAHRDDHRRAGRDARRLDGLAAVARDPGRGRRAGAHAVGMDPVRRARLGPADPARGRQDAAASSTTSASPGRCRWPRPACRPSSPPTRTTPRTRPTPSCRARSPMRQARYNLTNLLDANGEDRPARAGGAASACARPSASRSTSRRRSPAGCATRRRRRRRDPRAAARAPPPAARRRPPIRRSCRDRCASSPGSASTPRRVRTLEPYVVDPARASTCGQRQHGVARGPRRRDRGLDLATAERIVQARQRGPIEVARRPRSARRRRCQALRPAWCSLQLLRGARPPAPRRRRPRAALAGEAAADRRGQRPAARARLPARPARLVNRAKARTSTANSLQDLLLSP